MEKFVQGQRWISATEPELGLGMVIEVANRRVQLLFPAGGEMRMYASESAPVKRVIFTVGDEVRGQDGVAFVVEEVRELDGVVTYVGAGNKELGEAALGDSMSFDKPQDRFFAGQVDEWRLFDLRLETLRKRHAAGRSPVRGFTGGRVELIPHQLYIAHEVSRRQIPRVLLADEVGLGKTIEACLILHRLLVSGKVGRTLILVPEALVHQWFVELLRRFNLNFAIYDEDRCAAIERGGEGLENPFLDEQLVLCSVEFLAENPHRAVSAVEAEWDMLIVDEAHHLGWSQDVPSPEYALVEALAQKSPGLLLLTATPEQLGLESHFARLRLLDQDRYPDFDRFVEEHEAFGAVAKEAEGLLDDPKALEELLDRHGPGRVMFRNTRSNMSGFPRRIPHLLPLVAEADEKRDPRVTWLAEFLREHPKKKVLLICRTLSEVKTIDEALRDQITVNTALFHEDMPLILRDRQAAWFAEDDGARLLIASEIGGEGRNFQFVQDLVLISLPDDPELLEQRIGRLDRIGQKHDIHIHVPYLEGSEEANRIRWYHEGLDAFSKPLVGGWEIQQKFKDRLDKISDKLIKETRTFCREVQTRIEQGRDRLLDLNSFRPAVAAEVVAQIEAADADRDLEEYLLQLFDHFGVHAEILDGRDYILMPGHLFDSAFPLPKDGMRITFDRQKAIVREDVTLMSWDHPMVEGGMELILGSEIGNSAVARSDDREGLVLEAVYLLECVAPARLEANRFLPPAPVVVQVDHALLDMVEEEVWVAPSGDANVWDILEDDMVKREIIPAMLKQARRVAMTERHEIIIKAREEMQQVLGEECKRLKHLQKVNDHVRADEVEAAFHQLTELDVALGKARLRLDAVRFLTDGRSVSL
jgi:ATP-dependent helicase HepA